MILMANANDSRNGDNHCISLEERWASNSKIDHSVEHYNFIAIAAVLRKIKSHMDVLLLLWKFLQWLFFRLGLLTYVNLFKITFFGLRVSLHASLRLQLENTFSFVFIYTLLIFQNNLVP